MSIMLRWQAITNNPLNSFNYDRGYINGCSTRPNSYGSSLDLFTSMACCIFACRCFSCFCPVSVREEDYVGTHEHSSRWEIKKAKNKVVGPSRLPHRPLSKTKAIRVWGRPDSR